MSSEYRFGIQLTPQSAQDVIDAAAAHAGRDPSSITRLAQIVGHITPDTQGVTLKGETPIHASSDEWASVLADLGT